MKDTLRNGCAAGLAGDLLDAPRDLVARGKLDYLTLLELAL